MDVVHAGDRFLNDGSAVDQIERRDQALAGLILNEYPMARRQQEIAPRQVVTEGVRNDTYGAHLDWPRMPVGAQHPAPDPADRDGGAVDRENQIADSEVLDQALAFRRAQKRAGDEAFEMARSAGRAHRAGSAGRPIGTRGARRAKCAGRTGWSNSACYAG